MKLHRNAALSWRGRRRLARRVVVEGWTLKAAAEAASVSVRCARKWVGRYRLEGELGLGDRSSAPQRVANRTPVERVEAIVKLRRLRFTAAEIAETLAMPPSTVSGILTRRGLGRLGRLGLEPPVRDERSHPGELLHVDVKKLGRIERGAGKHWRDGKRQHYTDAAGRVRRRTGWEYVHIAVDDYSCLAYAEVLPDEKATTAVGFLRRATTFYRRHGINVERVLTDNGSASAQTCTRSAAVRSVSATSAADPTDHRPMAKPNASSAPSSTAGPTAPSTEQATNAPTHLTPGSGTTTIDADTQPSATNARSAEPSCSGPTARTAVTGHGLCSRCAARLVSV
jgi:transposase